VPRFRESTEGLSSLHSGTLITLVAGVRNSTRKGFCIFQLPSVAIGIFPTWAALYVIVVVESHRRVIGPPSSAKDTDRSVFYGLSEGMMRKGDGEDSSCRAPTGLSSLRLPAEARAGVVDLRRASHCALYEFMRSQRQPSCQDFVTRPTRLRTEKKRLCPAYHC
jgi:hypothetical protein